MFNPYDIAAAAGQLAIDLADYLRRSLLPEVEPTTPISPPYELPFEGGQCAKLYNIEVSGDSIATGSPVPFTVMINSRMGAFTAPVFEGSQWIIRNTAGVVVVSINTATNVNLRVSNIIPQDGIDNCGNLPNPNPAPPIGSDGLANSPAIEIEDDDNLVLGAPVVVIPSISAIVAAVGAAVRAAVDALNAIKDIMDAIEVIADAIDAIKDWLDDKNKDDDTKKALYLHNYGSIRKDGFLRLYPSGEVSGFEPQYIDLQLLSIPIGYGKYFGDLSPNFYRFKSLGHISFVSASFGILGTHELEFTRVSLTVPANAYGFFYHIGLEDAIRANVSLFYLKNVE